MASQGYGRKGKAVIQTGECHKTCCHGVICARRPELVQMMARSSEPALAPEDRIDDRPIPHRHLGRQVRQFT